MDEARVSRAACALAEQRLRAATVLVVDGWIMRQHSADGVSRRLLVLAAQLKATFAILANAGETLDCVYE